ncbi:MAG: nucleoside triphosphate pyrophosphohydrolase [Gammaproteobacteria bacterium]|nr:nucleoside triphosphate pyrophosphohydrolase [Gammaproteobacteria bacterium]MDH3859773.1 nucleoside triphosphate pyrophosphohydrolase [Gammaproteobacteria bacterium]
MSTIENLLQVMRDLRHPDNGCPWDIRQTSASIAGYTLDETHELLDAIERDDTQNLKEELGDLLFNIVFHARIAEEKGQFTFDDVAQGITDKMLRRHPHVFGETRDQILSEETLSQQWQALKQQEKSAQAQAKTELGSDPGTNSAIYRARQIQNDAAGFGFDWPDINSVFDKLEEELAELRHAFNSGDRDAISDEIGDLMFVCVNLARHARVNAEMSLRNTNRKFLRRFAYVQQQMANAGIEMDQQQLERMEQFWQESKNSVG